MTETTMTPEQINIAIAEACGWKWHGEATYGGTQCNGWWKDDRYSFHGIPNYHGDLNACAAMEATTSYLERAKYADTLYAIIPASQCSIVASYEGEHDFGGYFGLLTATAPQRCEAFLRTKGLWK